MLVDHTSGLVGGLYPGKYISFDRKHCVRVAVRMFSAATEPGSINENMTYTPPQDRKVVETGAPLWRENGRASSGDGSLSDSNSDPSSDDGGCSN